MLRTVGAPYCRKNTRSFLFQLSLRYEPKRCRPNVRREARGILLVLQNNEYAFSTRIFLSIF
ncbi:hypothetical protein HanPI659440_Chr11g0439321 [Helianthus annuus]|nr:hypothetical protein HanHA300_Chr11g0423741 [Helianthus annuus]KAJ0511716.1 hypothetical protein HanIR_Chr11g0555201 [Helianthus annuus]KAJ0519351.1 hypothetical protein HanHA89_Chr11g0447791 [Helianthus annuus]KAJ0687353.1 hypothetical protein HanLR1_Chr11g0425101 [Helianthus annuus]KAJ0691148.1 hypothetical protein HanOQP8_Chr11g0425841 [Helianthus annuus]